MTSKQLRERRWHHALAGRQDQVCMVISTTYPTQLELIKTPGQGGELQLWHVGGDRGRYSHCGLVELRRNTKLYIGINLVSSVYSCARLIIWFIASPVDRFSGVGRARLRGGPELSIG